MAVSAVETRSSPASVRMPGVASTAIRDALSEPQTPGTVLGTARHAIWLLVDGDVIVASTRDATRLPNGVEVAADARMPSVVCITVRPSPSALVNCCSRS